MTISPTEKNDDLSREALHWLIALRDDPDDRQLRSRFEAWLAISDAHQRAWQEAEHTWSLLGNLPEATQHRATGKATASSDHRRDVTGGRSLHTAATSANNRGVARQRLALRRSAGGTGRHFGKASVAAALAAACIAIAYLPTFSTWLEADYATGTGEVRRIELADGSEVYLGASSAITVDLSAEARRVSLLSGQAFFEVAPNQHRPFAVIGNGVETRVLGTAFDVRVLSDGATIAVDHGSVAVGQVGASASDGPLGPGDWARVDIANGAIERGTGADAGAWRDGKLVAIDEEVDSVVDELRRYYSGRIVILSASLGQQRVSGVYRLNDPIAALRAVAEANGASVQQISPWLVVVYGG
ncbi:FecR domain-containing protein [Hyphomicrobium sp. D-2]|uniref:FecR family protein n=1 Tax=Hyphomicrobium sp. D-2 TaxID=3041621 RepID=UPI002459106D|nr:FecR domain-containing protein [Hyphomicrobium sp. D-2]MDH4980713.1 FecR domain-containing protein [Hyphomicrobium sp. D-2]